MSWVVQLVSWWLGDLRCRYVRPVGVRKGQQCILPMLWWGRRTGRFDETENAHRPETGVGKVARGAASKDQQAAAQQGRSSAGGEDQIAMIPFLLFLYSVKLIVALWCWALVMLVVALLCLELGR